MLKQPSQLRDVSILSYVTDFFAINYPGCAFQQISEETAEFDVSLSNDAKHDLATFLHSERLDGTTQLTRNDLRAIRCRFENRAIGTRGARIEIVSQFHPLVRFVSHRISQREHYFHPTMAVRLSNRHVPVAIAPGTYVFSVQRWSLLGLQEIERLYFAAVPLDTPDRPLEPEQAEQLATNAANHGKDWLAAPDTTDLSAAAQIANDCCLGQSDERYDDYVREIQAQNYDRVDVQERTLDRHVANQMRTLEEVREKHRARGRQPLVRATEGRMQALTNRVERRRKEIHERREIRHYRDEICVGVIAVVEEESDLR